MKKAVFISVFSIIFAGFLSVPSVQADPLIEVDPLTYDFGDVELGTSVTTIFTITNFNGHILEVYDIYLQGSTDFSITNPPALPSIISPGNTMDVEVTFSPTIEGYSSAVMDIESNDASNPIVSVNLGGMGVFQEQPPASVADILAFFDASVANGTLVGNGPGNSADSRRNALRNMIEAAGDLIDSGNILEACMQLQNAYRRTDGLAIPPEFVAGPPAPTLAGMILDLMGHLGCE